MPEMSEKVLFVDDNPNVLEGFRRQLRKLLPVETAAGAEEGLGMVKNKGPFAVIVSDMRMPRMDGIQFLSQVKEISPDSVRMMLTGNADQETAIQAVNEGSIFRFLTKPCAMDVVTQALMAGIKQYRLITAEKELLEKTLNGSVEVIMELLAMVDQESLGYVRKVSEYIKDISSQIIVGNVWELELAAMFARIGFITVPTELRNKYRTEEPLVPIEEAIISRVPEIGQRLLARIPRLESVAKIVLYQNKKFNGAGFPKDSVMEEKIPSGSRILKILVDLVQLESKGIEREEALNQMKKRMGWYDPKLLGAISKYFSTSEKAIPELIPPMDVNICDLRVGDLLVSPVETFDDRVLVAGGNRITQPTLEKLWNYDKLARLREPVKIRRVN